MTTTEEIRDQLLNVLVWPTKDFWTVLMEMGATASF